jgi:hypothetical protein
VKFSVVIAKSLKMDSFGTVQKFRSAAPKLSALSAQGHSYDKGSLNNVIVQVPATPGALGDALNKVAGHHTQDIVFQLAPGIHIESDLDFTRFATSLDKADNDLITQTGFRILGDSRDHAGLRLVHNAFVNNELGVGGMGDDGATVTLTSAGNTISVALTGTPIDFVALGVVPGDTILLKSNAGGAPVERSVVSVAATSLVYDGAPVTVGGVYPIGFLSYLELCPNTQLIPNHSSSGFRINLGCSVKFKGVWINDDLAKGAIAGPGFGLIQVLSGNTLDIKNCLIQATQPMVFAIFVRQGKISCTTASNTSPPNTLLLPADGSVVFGILSDQGVLGLHGMHISGGILCLYATILSTVEMLHNVFDSCLADCINSIFGSTTVIQGRCSLIGASGGITMGFGTVYEASVFQLDIDCSSDGTTPLPSSIGISPVNQAKCVLDTSNNIRNCVSGIRMRTASELIYADMTFTNCTNTIIRGEGCKFVDSSAYPYSETRVGAFAVENAHEVQRFSGAGFVGTMDPAVLVEGLQTYLGLTYTFSTDGAAAHTISGGGAMFYEIGDAAAPGKALITLPATADECVRLFVRDATHIDVLYRTGGVTVV